MTRCRHFKTYSVYIQSSKSSLEYGTLATLESVTNRGLVMSRRLVMNKNRPWVSRPRKKNHRDKH